MLINLSALFFYKYLSFFIENINILLNFLQFPSFNDPQIKLPIGISFYVFQLLSYIIDVYRGEIKPQKNIINLAAYISLFPQLIAGPIVRYQTIIADLTNRKTNVDNIYYGLRRFSVGLAKKVLIADQLALIADTIFGQPTAQVPCFFAWLGALAYAFQIFYDFSAYSDMAIGLGRIFNFHFLENFNYPYSSLSIREFWRRWHISLSSWLRDYLYIPLGGNKKSKARTYLNLFIVFTLCGLWHGATWNFVVWGLYHGTLLVIERLGLSMLLDTFPKILANLYVWIFIIIGWVVFRADTLPHAISYLNVMFLGNPDVSLNSFRIALDFINYSNVLIFLLAFFFSYPLFETKYQNVSYTLVDTAFILFLFVIAFTFTMTSTFSPFIYFRF